MKPTLFHLIFFATLLAVSLQGCSNNEDQRDFEREAFSLPSGFTETRTDGSIVNEDPDDWRTAPFFEGLVFVRPASPNPVAITDQTTIDVDVTGIESVNGLRVIVLFQNFEQRIVFESASNPLPPGLTSVPLLAAELRQFENTRGLQRVILLDRSQNVISYGDIMLE
ncbi:MAG: hypothetical protein ACNA78_03795 [Balneolaceae bacterium]